jgi:FKBP-type peptidyl-prolyl cis-trans isomerase
MTLPARRRGRILLVYIAVAAAFSAGTLAQQPPSAGAASGTAAPATGTAAAKKAPAKSAAANAASSERNAASYSLGVSMGDQLHSNGVPADAVNFERLAQGVHDALNGKVKMTEQDNVKISKMVREAYLAAGETNHRAAASFLSANGKKPEVVTTASGLQYKVLSAGSGDSPKASDKVTVNYRGTLLDGSEFDSSYKHGQAATFEVGRVIPGWTEALQLMKPGAKYQLFVPPQLAYDLRPRPGIPPGSLLIFEVELLSVAASAEAAPTAAPPASAAPPAPPTPSPKQ